MGIDVNVFRSVFNAFNHGATFQSIEELTSGHINDTYFVKAEGRYNFVLQRINQTVFKKAKELIINKVKVSEHLQEKLSHLPQVEMDRRVLRFIRTHDGLPYHRDAAGNYWNLTYFIEGSETFETVTDSVIAYEGGKLFGEFLNLARDLDISEIVDIIPNFHKMSFRYSQFYDALEQANPERIELAHKEIEKVNALKEEMHILQTLKDQGRIPMCVTHNDTKISNALFDGNNKGLCVIDTDTVMVGIVHYDYGDAIRTICNTTYEDDEDLSRVQFNISYFEGFTRGFLEQIHEQMTEFSVQLFPLAAKTITFIMGLRMLTDFLNNDIYYKTRYETHNLVRAKNQFALVDRITACQEELEGLVMDQFRKLKTQE
jgi:hypothetical protein